MQDSNSNQLNSLGPVQAQRAGKYLAFPLSTQLYGLEILRVQEIISVSTITRVPRSNSCIKGVINLRGKIIPVVDLRLKFNLPAIKYNEKTCVVIVNIKHGGQATAVGVIVDTVQEVMHFDESQIESAPDYGNRLDNRFIIGMGRKNSSEDTEVVVLLDIEKALSEVDLQS